MKPHDRHALNVRLRHVLYLTIHIFLIVLGLLLAQARSVVVQGIGISLAAAGIAGAVVFLYVIEAQRVSDQIAILNDFGLIRVFASRSVRIRETYEGYLQNFSRTIDIMGFGLRAFREDYHGQFATWATKGTVRVLLLDPEAPCTEHNYADQRDNEEGNRSGSIRGDVLEFIRLTAPLLETPNLKFHIRLFRSIPSVNIFRIDEHLFWGPYIIGEQSRNMPTFLTREGGILFGRFTTHFENIWSSDHYSREVPKAWLKDTLS